MSDLAKILAENQEKMMKLVAPTIIKPSAHQNAQDPDSETENISAACTSNPVKANKAIPKTTPINSCNKTYISDHFPKFSSLITCFEKKLDTQLLNLFALRPTYACSKFSRTPVRNFPPADTAEFQRVLSLAFTIF